MSEKFKKKIIILDYDIGNVKSIYNAFRFNLANVQVSRKKEDIIVADGLVLPGVGAFAKGMENLNKYKLIDQLYLHAEKEKPILGICLGMQLLLESSHEFGRTKGLGFFKGEVRKLESGSKKLKIPFVGWNKLCKPNKIIKWNESILKNINEDDLMYFVHSYYVDLVDRDENLLSNSFFGEFEFPSSIVKKNIYGCQFHPEKSSISGLKIINNFIKLCQ